MQYGIGNCRDSLQSPTDSLLPKLRWLMGKSSQQVRHAVPGCTVLVVRHWPLQRFTAIPK